MKDSRVVKLDAEDNLVMAEPGQTIMLIGVNNLLVVNEKNRLLVADLDMFERAEKVWKEECSKEDLNEWAQRLAKDLSKLTD